MVVNSLFCSTGLTIGSGHSRRGCFGEALGSFGKHSFDGVFGCLIALFCKTSNLLVTVQGMCIALLTRHWLEQRSLRFDLLLAIDPLTLGRYFCHFSQCVSARNGFWLDTMFGSAIVRLSDL